VPMLELDKCFGLPRESVLSSRESAREWPRPAGRPASAVGNSGRGSPEPRELTDSVIHPSDNGPPTHNGASSSPSAATSTTNSVTNSDSNTASATQHQDTKDWAVNASAVRLEMDQLDLGELRSNISPWHSCSEDDPQREQEREREREREASSQAPRRQSLHTMTSSPSPRPLSARTAATTANSTISHSTGGTPRTARGSKTKSTASASASHLDLRSDSLSPPSTNHTFLTSTTRASPPATSPQQTTKNREFARERPALNGRLFTRSPASSPAASSHGPGHGPSRQPVSARAHRDVPGGGAKWR